MRGHNSQKTANLTATLACALVFCMPTILLPHPLLSGDVSYCANCTSYLVLDLDGDGVTLEFKADRKVRCNLEAASKAWIAPGDALVLVLTNAEDRSLIASEQRAEKAISGGLEKIFRSDVNGDNTYDERDREIIVGRGGQALLRLGYIHDYADGRLGRSVIAPSSACVAPTSITRIEDESLLSRKACGLKPKAKLTCRHKAYHLYEVTLPSHHIFK